MNGTNEAYPLTVEEAVASALQAAATTVDDYSDLPPEARLDPLPAWGGITVSLRALSEVPANERAEIVDLYMSDPRIGHAELEQTYRLTNETVLYEILREANVRRGKRYDDDGNVIATRGKTTMPEATQDTLAAPPANGEVQDLPQVPPLRHGWRVRYTVVREDLYPEQGLEQLVSALRAVGARDVELIEKL